MSDASKKMLFRFAIHALVGFVLYLFQASVFAHLRLWGVTPLILPLAVVSIALFEGPGWGFGFGLYAGVLTDIALAESTIMFTLLLCALGFFIGLMSNFMLARGFPSYLLCAGLSLVLIAFFQLFGLLVFYGQPPRALFTVAALQSLYSMFFALPIYYLGRRLAKQAITK